MTGSTNLFQNKMGINFGATFNPYAIDDAGTQLDVLNINNGGGLARLTNANLTMNYSFSSKNFKGKDNTNNVATGVDQMTYLVQLKTLAIVEQWEIQKKVMIRRKLQLNITEHPSHGI